MKKNKAAKIWVLSILAALILSSEAYAYWVEDDYGWRYKTPDETYLRNEWEWIDGDYDGIAECYYFDGRGYLLQSGFKDGYTVNSDGEWTINGAVQTKDLKGLQGWQDLNGTEVYVDMDGTIWREQITPDNVYVNQYGWKVTDSGIDETMMAEKSQNCRYIAINKSTNHLELWENGIRKQSFIISSGLNEGDKEYEGDKKTPEGEFYVCKKIPTSNYHLALGVSYPAIEDAERGLVSGLINEEQYAKIVAANQRGDTPDWHTNLGGYIEIHGNRQPADVTSGCVAMRNEDIELLYSLTEKGDRIIIFS